MNPVIEVNRRGSDVICSISDDVLSQIRIRTSKILDKAVDTAFKYFPISRTSLKCNILNSFITKKNICRLFTATSGITRKNYNNMLKRYRSEKLSPSRALKLGLIAKKLALRGRCIPHYNWKESPFYNGVNSCDDILDIIKVGMPMVMYHVETSADVAEKTIASSAIYYTNFKNDGPVNCLSEYAEPKEKVIYDSIAVHPLYTLDFIIANYFGKNWATWKLLKSCITPSGEKIEEDDLKFDFGMRIFIPVKISSNGKINDETIIISGVAATSNSGLAGILSKKTPFYRYIGGAFAKRILLFAKSMNWKLSR